MLEDARNLKGDGVVTSAKTLQAIVDAAHAAGGPNYQPIWIDPEPDREGGIPVGNIRVALLVDPARVGGNVGDDLAVLDADVADFAVEAVGRVVDPTVGASNAWRHSRPPAACCSLVSSHVGSAGGAVS